MRLSLSWIFIASRHLLSRSMAQSVNRVISIEKWPKFICKLNANTFGALNYIDEHMECYRERNGTECALTVTDRTDIPLLFLRPKSIGVWLGVQWWGMTAIIVKLIERRDSGRMGANSPIAPTHCLFQCLPQSLFSNNIFWIINVSISLIRISYRVMFAKLFLSVKRTAKEFFSRFFHKLN